METKCKVVKVVIIDDNTGYRAIASEVINATDGFEVLAEAADEQQALRLLAAESESIDLVLMDVNLGDGDGIALTRQAIGRWPELNVLLLTAIAFDDLPPDAADCGARGYLSKSQFSPSALRDAVDGVYDWPR